MPQLAISFAAFISSISQPSFFAQDIIFLSRAISPLFHNEELFLLFQPLLSNFLVLFVFLLSDVKVGWEKINTVLSGKSEQKAIRLFRSLSEMDSKSKSFTHTQRFSLISGNCSAASAILCKSASLERISLSKSDDFFL